jgi:acyl-[acyl-carrier-protein] desaturase
MKFSELTRLEVMHSLNAVVDGIAEKYLKPVEEYWQPADMLPDASLENFFDEVKLLQERASLLSYDVLAVLIGDTITEEALPTYESWLYAIEGINPNQSLENKPNSWTRWIRAWTGEENRHGDLLNKYLYLSGRVNMKAFEISTQHLITDGFDIGTANDPYKNFIYTSFQELATQVSHRRVATLAKKEGETHLARICASIAADEGRHATAYAHFVEKIYEIDPSQMMLAFEYMMKQKIVMPAHFLREMGMQVGELWGHFTDAAQRIEVYTTHDYIDILSGLIKRWKLNEMSGLTFEAEKAQEYLLRLPDRLTRIADRMKTPQSQHKFSWILA